MTSSRPTAFETSSGIRNRRVVAGTGMVTPVRLCGEFGVNGPEVYEPGTTRLAVDHPAVVKAPWNFKPCDKTDGATYTRMKAILAAEEKRTIAAIERMRRTPRGRASAARPRLSGGPVGTWKL